MGAKAGTGQYGKSPLSPGLDPRTVQPVANRYTEYAILAHKYFDRS
jgi:hypothetical protein